MKIKHKSRTHDPMSYQSEIEIDINAQQHDIVLNIINQPKVEAVTVSDFFGENSVKLSSILASCSQISSLKLIFPNHANLIGVSPLANHLAKTPLIKSVYLVSRNTLNESFFQLLAASGMNEGIKKTVCQFPLGINANEIFAKLNLVNLSNKVETFELASAVDDSIMEQWSKTLLSDEKLKNLKINYSHLTADGVKKLCYIMRKNSNIASIDLAEGRQIGPEGFKVIGEFLKTNTSLKYLNLSCCSGKDEGLDFIAEGLKYNSTLRRLDVSINDASQKQTKIFKSLKNNNTLVYLNVINCNITDDERDLLKLLITNKALIKILGGTLEMKDLTEMNWRIFVKRFDNIVSHGMLAMAKHTEAELSTIREQILYVLDTDFELSRSSKIVYENVCKSISDYINLSRDPQALINRFQNLAITNKANNIVQL